MWIFAGISWAGALVLWWLGKRSQRRMLAMHSVDTYRAADLHELATKVAAEIGAGSFRQAAEVKGTIQCDEPLQSQLGGIACVYFDARVTQEYEETYTTTDSEGKRVRRTRRGSEVMSHTTSAVPFFVEDASGRMEVKPDGAEFIAESVTSRFEPSHADRTSISLGHFLMNVMPAASGRRILGYRYEERAIPLRRDVYVLGEASDGEGRLRIQKPEAKELFLISLKSEAQLTESARRWSLGFRVGAAVAALAGVLAGMLEILQLAA